MAFTVWTSTNLTDRTEDTGAVQTATAIPSTDNESVEVTLSDNSKKGSYRFGLRPQFK